MSDTKNQSFMIKDNVGQESHADSAPSLAPEFENITGLRAGLDWLNCGHRTREDLLQAYLNTLSMADDLRYQVNALKSNPK